MSGPLYRIGDVLRTGGGSTALMQVTVVAAGHGGAVARYWGIHCLGGYHGAYHEDVRPADAADLATWREQARWRRRTRIPQGHDIVGMYED